jgi:acetoin utilization protein AcuB
MTTKLITVTADTLLHDAEKLMKDNRIRRLPVVDNKGKLVGLITRDKLRDVAPSPATSLSIWELNYLLSKIKVGEIMQRDVVIFTPDMTVEEATTLCQTRGIGTLPIVQDDKLVGIATTTDLYNILVQVLGFGKPGVRFHLFACDGGDPLKRAIDIIHKHGGSIQSMFQVIPPGVQRTDTIIRTNVVDATKIVQELRAEGCEVDVRSH